jgi:hypothetical protein
MWYVEDYLIPSLKEQNIENIDVRVDKFNRGNLEQCMQIFSIMTGDGGTWHLQDDIIICKDFKMRTEQFTSDVVCGFVWDRDTNKEKIGYVSLSDMWFSFPCIHIPNKMALECSQWFFNKARYDQKYMSWVAGKKYDDLFFREFLRIYYPDQKILNLKPNLVDHIDFLLGGTTVPGSIQRGEQVRAQYFEDLELVDELTKKIGKEL